MSSAKTIDRLIRTHRQRVDSLHELSAWFWMMVSVDPETHCWLWQGARDKNGYGRFKAAGQRWLAHRASLYLVRGPSKLHALHRCDNPSCISPFHLYYGTHKQNMHDMQARGHKAILIGTANANSRLTESNVAMIRSSKATLELLALMFGTTRQYIWKVKNRWLWKHVYP